MNARYFRQEGGLKVKKNSLLIVVAMLSIIVFSISPAHARLSANDFVPGQDVVVPIICEGTLDAQNNPVFGGLNTNIAVAEMRDGAALPDPDSAYVVTASLTVYDPLSRLVYDDKRKWTKYDVVVDNCQDMVLDAPASARARMRVNMPRQDGSTVSLFVGYAVYRQDVTTLDRFVPWAYLIDLTKGFASGFNGVSAEDGLGPQMGEDGGSRPVTMNSIFPRIFLLNGLKETWNWWILLFGRNELGLINPIQWTATRYLDGFMCDEQELCRSVHIPIPHELNLIDVLTYLPNDIKTACGFPASSCGGFARLTITESGSQLFPAISTVSITGTANGALPLVSPPEFYSGYGWSYQRAADSSATLSWDVMHEIHRIYCSGPGTGSAQGENNAQSCPVTIN